MRRKLTGFDSLHICKKDLVDDNPVHKNPEIKISEDGNPADPT